MIRSTGRSSTKLTHRPSGTVRLFGRIPGNKLPGYDHPVPSGQQISQTTVRKIEATPNTTVEDEDDYAENERMLISAGDRADETTFRDW